MLFKCGLTKALDKTGKASLDAHYFCQYILASYFFIFFTATARCLGSERLRAEVVEMANRMAGCTAQSMEA